MRIPDTHDIVAIVKLIDVTYVSVPESHKPCIAATIDIGRRRPEINVRHILQEVVSALAENRIELVTRRDPPFQKSERRLAHWCC